MTCTITKDSMNTEIIKHELHFQTARSSGSGGQHVNKVETKVSLRFYVAGSRGLSEAEKRRILRKLDNRINNDGFLIVEEQGSRSQNRNKRTAEHRFFELLREAVKKPKRRKGHQPRRANPKKRLESKRRRGEKKALRKKIRPQDL